MTETSELLNVGGRYRLSRGEEAELVALPPAKLELPTGRIVVGDPAFFIELGVEIPVTLRPGTVELTCHALRWETGPPSNKVLTRVTAAYISDGSPIATWEPIDLMDGARFGFSAGGVGVVADAIQREFLESWEDDEEYLDDLLEGLREDSLVQVSNGSDDLAVVFDCGMGDGWYPVLIGRDEAGEACAVLFDLELIHHTTPIRS
jgi:hypothetical protein